MNIVHSGPTSLSMEVDGKLYSISTEGWSANKWRLSWPLWRWYFNKDGKFVWTSDYRKAE